MLHNRWKIYNFHILQFKHIPMKFCSNSGFASLWTRCIWFDGLSQHVSFIVLWLLTCFYLCACMHTSSPAKKLARSWVNSEDYVEYTPLRLSKWISEFKCPFSYCIELYWSTLEILLHGVPFPKKCVLEPLKLFRRNEVIWWVKL